MPALGADAGPDRFSHKKVGESMSVSSVKLRMLYIMKILLDKTDEAHPLSAADIDRRLDGYGMSADRKTIYSDIETLREFGLDIIQAKGTNGGYYVAEREFELAELKLLVDAVQSSKFISQKKSERLIKNWRLWPVNMMPGGCRGMSLSIAAQNLGMNGSTTTLIRSTQPFWRIGRYSTSMWSGQSKRN